MMIGTINHNSVMKSISKNIIFYITIMERNEGDHTFLRRVIQSVLPQAIVESIYDDKEAGSYFNNSNTLPHLIFLDQDMLQVSGSDTLQLIKQVKGLDEVPIVFLTNTHNLSQKEDIIKQKVEHFYLRPYKAEDLITIVGSLNNKWLA